jgi:hypothetical protein
MAKTTTFKTLVGDVKLSAKGVKAFEALCRTGGDVQLAVAYLKQNAPSDALCERQLRRIRDKPGLEGLMRAKARHILASHEPMAAERMVQLMKQDDSKKVSFEASRRILDIANIRPPDAPGPQVNIGIGVMPSRHVIDDDMPPEEVKAIKAEWANYRGPGYLLDWRSDAAIEAEANEVAKVQPNAE